MKIPTFHDQLVVEDINLSCLSTLLQCTRVQRFHKRCFIYLFVYFVVIIFLMKVNLCLKLADGSDEYHKCAIVSQILVYIFCWMLILAKKWNFSTTKHLSDPNEDARDETVIYCSIWRWEWLVWRVEWINKEIARDALRIRIAIACISIFELLIIRYCCIWLSNIW